MILHLYCFQAPRTLQEQKTKMRCYLYYLLLEYFYVHIQNSPLVIVAQKTGAFRLGDNFVQSQTKMLL